jgi:type III pantothenate kinase
MDSEQLQLVTIDVGNSNTSIARWDTKEITDLVRLTNNDPPAIVAEVARQAEQIAEAEHGALVLSSVNEPFGAQLAQQIIDATKREVFVVGDDLPLDCKAVLDPEALTGNDRLLAGIGAFDQYEQACAIIDAGTAVTVDFIDGTGVFHGGAIVPGCRAWLAVLRAAAPALPEVEPATPAQGAFGKNTKDAMLHGMFYGVRGLVRHLVERYAEEYNAYPKVIATGGDADLLFKDDDFVEQIVPGLVHRGMAVCAKRALAEGEHQESQDDAGA